MHNILRAALALTVCVCLVVFAACSNRNKQEAYPSSNKKCVIDTAHLSYKNDIVPILSANYCYKCHGNGNSSDGQGIVLEGYDNLTAYMDSSGGTILYDITLPSSDSHFMPKNAYQMDTCSINKIKLWAKNGYNNN